MSIVESANRTLLDDGPLVAMKTGSWCCLLCERQFKSEQHLAKHLDQSSLHKENISKATTSGRIRNVGIPDDTKSGHSDKRPIDATQGELDTLIEQPQVKRERTAAETVPSSSGSMSALEQMELFEMRLKAQAREKAKDKSHPYDNVDSNKARTINNQMDWECGECGQFNFARTVVCHTCKAHVDSNTKYLSNRLKELKQERFARVFGQSKMASDFVADPVAEHAHQRGKLTAENNVGHSMLASMGWKGGGLGRAEEGMAEPIRPGSTSASDGDRRRAAFQC
eukprot:CAMPEP_0119308908 /NCGR_PEP_ID=MMETSP1333-20130426/12841_1 /TAXON_ID=418940 /ORGANISM="Scyphosphaera apsteinii, Strain RCC1455" /LENGTH=281 /DNA_ID=CAMNT_0007312787 /DNA_START=54 /DNA_END=899 /DNA_ORIENTATION=+